MSIRAHVRKLKPISEDFENPVDKLDMYHDMYAYL